MNEKITNKTSKEDLVKYLAKESGNVKVHDKALYDKIAYAYNMYKKDVSKVARKDLVDLAKAVMKCLGTQEPNTEKQAQEEPEQPAVENQVKKTLKKGKKAENVQEEEPQVDNKKSANKTGAKSEKKEAPKSAVTPLSINLAGVFSESFETDGHKFEIAKDIKTMKDLYNALMNSEPIIFAMYWTEQHLMQFPYFENRLEAPEQFPLDLDLCECLHVSEQYKVAYAISMYTEAMYMLTPESLKEKKGIRYSNGIEYQIYRQVDEETEEAETE